MGRPKGSKNKKKTETVEIEDSSLLEEFNVRITDDRNKLVCITYIKARNKETALNKIMADYKNKPYSYMII